MHQAVEVETDEPAEGIERAAHVLAAVVESLQADNIALSDISLGLAIVQAEVDIACNQHAAPDWSM